MVAGYLRSALAASTQGWQQTLFSRGFDDMFTPVTSLHWMGAWPQDDAQCAALVAYGGTLAAIGAAVSVFARHNPGVVKSVLSIRALPLIHKADHAFVTGRR